MERFVFRPWGVNGGRPGEKARVVLNMGTPDERELGKLDILHAEPGDVVTIMTPGGGGYGDPLDRPPSAVLEDVRLGYIGAGPAERDYGVVIAGEAVDAAATEAARTRLRAARGPAPAFDFGPEREAWDQVFDDASMLALNTLLMCLGPAAAAPRRRALFERVVPALRALGNTPMHEAIGDIAAARVRLGEELERLRAELPG